MKNISKDNLVRGLQILYKLWNREFPDDYPSKYHLEWEMGEPYDFYMKYQKQLEDDDLHDDIRQIHEALLS